MAPAAALDIGVDTGAGHPIVILPGFGLAPFLYRHTAELLADTRKARVVVPDIYHVGGSWRCDEVVERLRATFETCGMERVVMVAHSFAGAVQLGFATRSPEQIIELVFVDTLAVSRERPLAREAMSHPFRLARMATPTAAVAFLSEVARSPTEIAQAAWWGFTSGRSSGAEQVARLGIPAHVLWANRDSLLSRRDGQAFARELGASFDVVRAPNGRAVDHDWMYRHPRLFVAHVDELLSAKG